MLKNHSLHLELVNVGIKVVRSWSAPLVMLLPPQLIVASGMLVNYGDVTSVTAGGAKVDEHTSQVK